MENDEVIDWMKKQKFSKISEQKAELLSGILQHCIKPKNEKVLIISDSGYRGKRVAPILSYAYYLACKNLNLDTSIVLLETKKHNEKTQGEYGKNLENLPEKSIILVAVSDRLVHIKNHKSFRKFCNEKQHRFLSTPSLGNLKTEEFDILFKTININYQDLEERQNNLKKQLDKASMLQITTPNGTDLTLNIEEIDSISSTGIFTEPGTGGNLPGGEVYLYPHKTGADGKVVIDLCLRTSHSSEVIKEPITLYFKKGKLIQIEGKEQAKKLQKSIDEAKEKAKYPDNVEWFAELGIGMNKAAKPSGVTIIDEKIYKTAHVAIGSNYWFGGPIRTIIHLDQVFKDPTIFLDWKEIEY